ncbi:MAG: hypothetical protein WAW26_22380 [Anaerolineae bacterium]
MPSFWQQFARLSPDVQRRAYRAYHLWRMNPFAGSLRFKRVSEQEPIYSIRIGLSHRALGLLDGNVIYWYFIGDHDDYERELGG